jgi:hypothetical protein
MGRGLCLGRHTIVDAASTACGLKITSVGTVMKVEIPKGSNSVNLLISASDNGHSDILDLSVVADNDRSLIVNIVPDRGSILRILRMSVRVNFRTARRWRTVSLIIWIHLRLVVPIAIALSCLGVLFMLLGGDVFWNGFGQICIIVAGILGVVVTIFKLILTPRTYPRVNGSGGLLLRSVPVDVARRAIGQNPAGAMIVE